MIFGLRKLTDGVRRLLRYRSLREANVWFDSSAKVDLISTFDGYNKVYANAHLINCHLGRFSYVGLYTFIANTDIGSFCSIGPGTRIGPSFHPTNWISTHPAFYSTSMQAGCAFVQERKFMDYKRTTIGNDVWIGAHAVVQDGVHIGDGAIIAAGAVVVTDVPPYTIVGGVPAKAIRKRFDDEVISELLNWKWWELPHCDLRSLAARFTADGNWTVGDLRNAIRPQNCSQ